MDKASSSDYRQPFYDKIRYYTDIGFSTDLCEDWDLTLAIRTSQASIRRR